MRVILCQIIRNTRQTRMHFSAAQILSRHNLTRRSLDKRRTGQENRTLLFHNDRHIRHRRHISAPSRARSHHNRNLRNAFSTHLRLIVKNSAKVVTIGKHLVLIGQVRTPTVDQINAWQTVLFGNLLRAQVLFHRHRVICATLHRRIITNDHDFMALHLTNAHNHTRTRGSAIIQPMRSRGTDFQKRRSRI